MQEKLPRQEPVSEKSHLDKDTIRHLLQNGTLKKQGGHMNTGFNSDEAKVRHDLKNTYCLPHNWGLKET